MLLPSLVAGAAAAGLASGPEGRDLFLVSDPVFEGNGPGGGVTVVGDDLGGDDAALRGAATASWTLRPVRLAVVLPVEAAEDHIDGLAPTLDALFVLSDRRRGGLGVAATLRAPLPWFGAHTPQATRAGLALGVGKAHTAVVVALEAPLGPPLSRLDWSVGASLPFSDALSGFAETHGALGITFSEPKVELALPSSTRVGLHLSPLPPLVLTFAVGLDPADLRAQAGSGPSLSVAALLIPQPRAHRPRTEGRDRDHDGVPDALDSCPGEGEDLDGGNDADGCPDGGLSGRAPGAPP